MTEEELLKLAEKSDDLGWKIMSGLGGAAIGASAFLASRPMIRGHYWAKIKNIGKGGARAAAERQGLPPQVAEEAKVIAKSLMERGIDPKTAKIGISGTPGTGKTTMAKALSQELGMAMGYADEAGRSLHSKKLTKHVAQHGAKPGHITEQTRLLNVADPDKFDVIIRMHKPTGAIKEQMQARGRGAAQWDFYDYKKLHGSIDNAFSQTKGTPFSPVKGVDVKFKPEGGFQANATLDASLQGRGINPSGLSREEKLLSLTRGKRTKGGQMAFMRKGPLAAGVASVGGGGAAGLGASYGASYLADKEKSAAVMYGFVDEMLKMAAVAGQEQQDPNWWQRNKWKALAGAGGAALGLGGFVMGKPMLRKHVGHDIRNLFRRGGSQAAERAKGLPQGALDDATKIWEDMVAQGIDPKTARIAIAGTGGTGKSTLARALAEKSGMNVLHLDDVGKTMTGRDLGKWLEKNPIQKGTIAEQTHLINQINPDEFDVILRIAKDPQVIKQQLKARGRGAGQWELYNYPRVHKAIETGFQRTGGKTRAPISGPTTVEYKIRPQEGFKADEQLDALLKAKGIDPSKMSRQEKIMAETMGRKPVSPGLIPYTKVGPAATGAAITAGGAGAGVGGAYLAERGLPQLRQERQAVKGTGSELGQRAAMARASVPRVARPPVRRVKPRKIGHLPIA